MRMRYGNFVRSSERGKGYAKEMLRLNMQNAKEMGMERLLVIPARSELLAGEIIK
uniref:hypothetical protein n=1 Tax=Agathobacter sp. TaxID=2021311 RepID=UPI004055BAF7